MSTYDYVIVGGGIAAVSCAVELRSIDENAPILLISGSPLLKIITNRVLIGQLTESFDIAEGSASDAFCGLNISVLNGKVVLWDAKHKMVKLEDGTEVQYGKLCIATGGRAKEIWKHERIISIRDTETVDRLRTRLKSSKRVVVVGNGGIATEIVYELQNVEIIWAIRHASISATFFDEGAAEFFKPMLVGGKKKESGDSSSQKQFKFKVSDEEIGKSSSGLAGCALGPDWASAFDVTGQLKERAVHVLYNVEMTGVVSSVEAKECAKAHSEGEESSFCSGDWPLWIRLSDGQVVGCDILVQATGVSPNATMWKEQCDQLVIAMDGGIVVDERMQSSVRDVYACGDVCTAGWQWAKHWMQMRLWTQARQMGAFCGRAMALPHITLDFCFELFTHVTNFFGFKVIFLGRFNGEGVKSPWHVLIRITKNEEYVKLIVHNGRIQGAVLIGETNMEETIENLILNEIDITDVEDGLLDPNIDIGDYFD